MFRRYKEQKQLLVHIQINKKMIELLIFHCHIVCGLYGFTKRWQEASVKEGIIAVLLFGLCFTILWALTGPVARLIVPDKGLAEWFTADTLSLVLVSIPDAVFFYFFFLKPRSAAVTS